jgi:two-component system chemotaxis response regulator CheY
MNPPSRMGTVAVLELDGPETSVLARVLVVEDALTVRLFYRRILEEAGYGVEEAVNGLEGLERALGAPFDLLIVDVNMQKMDGYRLVAALREEQTTRAIPVVMISTESEARDSRRAFEAGANFYLYKPVDPQVLTETVRLLTGQEAS